MGKAIARRRFLRHRNASYARPIVFCKELADITDDAISMNVAIAQRLADVSSAFRSMKLETCFVSALSDLPENVVIRDIDVLFNPAYEVNVVELLSHAYHSHQFDVVWPGRFENGKLLYAEEGYPDYKAFDIARYNITCIY